MNSNLDNKIEYNKFVDEIQHIVRHLIPQIFVCLFLFTKLYMLFRSNVVVSIITLTGLTPHGPITNQLMEWRFQSLVVKIKVTASMELVQL